MFPNAQQVWRYEEIRKIWHKGRRGVLLPNGVILGKALSLRLGTRIWMILGRRESGR